MTNEQIMYDSAEAAQYKTGLSGWVDRNGVFWGSDEHMARYSGCTHVSCKDCGTPIPVRGFTICDDCQQKKAIEKYNAMPRMKWDGETTLYSDADGEYFFDADGLRDYMEWNERTAESLRLIICKPNHFRQIDSDFFCDEVPEDGNLPWELEEAMETLNKVIRAQPPASWSPGKYAADVDELLKQREAV